MPVFANTSFFLMIGTKNKQVRNTIKTRPNNLTLYRREI